MEKNRINGYYRRETDGEEYVEYEAGGTVYITNGIRIWQKELLYPRNLAKLERTESVNVAEIIKRLEIIAPYGEAIKLLRRRIQE